MSAKDDKLGALYRARKAELQARGGNVTALIVEGRQWLAMRMACKANIVCLNVWYDQRIAALATETTASPSAEMPRTSKPDVVICNADGRLLAMTQRECDLAKARADAANRVREQKDRDKAQAAAAAEARANEERQFLADYPLMRFEDFQLDGRELAASEAKVALRGTYILMGNSEYLMPSRMAVIQFREYGYGNARIGLLSDQASRAVRKIFLECQNNPASSQVGCDVELLGRASICVRTTLVGKDEIPCFSVDDGKLK